MVKKRSRPSMPTIPAVDAGLIARATRLLPILAPSHLPTILDAVGDRAAQGLSILGPAADLWEDVANESEIGPALRAESERVGVPPEEIRRLYMEKKLTDPSIEQFGHTSIWLRSSYKLLKHSVSARHCFFATEEMTALVQAGATDAIEKVAATSADLPAPNGIAYFHRPSAGFFVLWGTRDDGLLQAAVCSAPMMMFFLETEPRPIPGGGPRERGFRALPFRQAQMSPAGSDDPPAPVEVQGALTQRLDNGKEAKSLTGDPLDSLSAEHAIPLLLSFTHMIRQDKLIDVSAEEHKSRTVNRRGQRRSRVDRITYLSYRPRTHSAGVSGSSRSYSHRWVVRGHWRRQWYPSQGRHIPIWITEHIAGPDDAPIVVRDKVTVVHPPRVD
jgi:hypothetical protein